MTKEELHHLIPEVTLEIVNRYQTANLLYVCPVTYNDVTGYYMELKVSSSKSPAYITTDILYLYEINFDERIIKGLFDATAFDCVKKAIHHKIMTVNLQVVL